MRPDERAIRAVAGTAVLLLLVAALAPGPARLR